MKKISLIIAGASLLAFTSCIEEYQPENSFVTMNQADKAPGTYENFVNAIISNLTGKPVFDDTSANNFGYSSLYLRRDAMGMDMVAYGGSHQWFNTSYTCGSGLAPTSSYCQYPWRFYYRQVKACNTVISKAGENPAEDRIEGAGIAYCMRAYYYLELAQSYAQKPYAMDKTTPTVPIVSSDVTEIETGTDLSNPRASYEDVMKFILSDLDKAEKYLANYKRPDKYHPDLSVVNGTRARAYLVMEDWANAEKYAKLAREGYTMLTSEQYIDRDHGFNDCTFGNSWMFSCLFKPDDSTIINNDSDSTWGSWMICELPGGATGVGYYNTYGPALLFDRHLYETLPATDVRKKCFIDFSLDNYNTTTEKDKIIKALEAYSDVPELVYSTGLGTTQFGGMSLKFRSKNGNHTSAQAGYCVDVPMMRVEEMYLIEAEAAGMQNLSRGIQLLTDFAKQRDPNYVYGTHNEAYGNSSTPEFRNEIWWQRRVEFWGEGLATFDIKRLYKGIIRNYPGTNHLDGYKWNTTTPPDWMNYCIIQTESNYNPGIVNNPTPVAPTGDSPEHVF